MEKGVYVSLWDNKSIRLESECEFDPITGKFEVLDFYSDVDVDILDAEFIESNGTKYEVCLGCHDNILKVVNGEYVCSECDN